MRNIFIVNATQVVVSESHPEGLLSVISGYPKYFDSRSYGSTETNPDGDQEMALRASKSEYFARLSANYTENPARVMSTVTLIRADGRVVMSESIGDFPVVTLEPTPEPEPEPEPEEQEGA